jgi:hypothetical protein
MNLRAMFYVRGLGQAEKMLVQISGHNCTIKLIVALMLTDINTALRSRVLMG